MEYKGFKIVKRGSFHKTFAHNGDGWVMIFREYELKNIEDARLLIDIHLLKKA